ncbi:RNA recognition rrm/rnp domain [Anaeramoeba flamelloides]|uniref:RNA recognition rrm/rnp domain n=1 Tax=Anaeramoeba flamelloides TaxID=1746091 RepID=A0ABQ8Y8Q6_9EUKA|nr:RNA recognition rrm/rnp domain [Anaeramoeba flamelloides]
MSDDRNRSRYTYSSSENSYKNDRRTHTMNKYSHSRNEESYPRERRSNGGMLRSKETFSLELRNIPDEMYDVTVLAKIGSVYGKLLKVHLNLNGTAWLKYEKYEETKLAYDLLSPKIKKFGASVRWPYRPEQYQIPENREKERRRDRDRDRDRERERDRERNSRKREEKRSKRKKSREKEEEKEKKEKSRHHSSRHSSKSFHSSSHRKREERSDGSDSDSDQYSHKKKNRHALKKKFFF